MEIYFNKIEEIRKKKKLSISKICKTIGITPMTFWHWQKGHTVPSEKRVRDIAYALKVEIDKISDLPPERKKSSLELKDNIDSWLILGGKDEGKRLSEHNLLVNLMKKQQEDLRQASVLVKAILSSINSVCYVKDANLKYLIANDAFLKLTSFKGCNVINCDDSFFFTNQEAKLNTEQDLQVLTTGKAIIGKETIMPGTRKAKWCLAYKYPIIDQQDNVAGIVGIFIDITEKREYERINELLKLSMDNGKDTIFLMNHACSKYLYISKSIEKIYGYPVDSFYNDMSFWVSKCLHPDFIKQEEEYRKDKKWPEIDIFKIISSSNEIKWIERRNFNGENYFLSIERDISDTIKSNAINHFLKDCINNISDAVMILDVENDKYVFVSNQVEKIYGYPAKVFYDDSWFAIKNCIYEEFKKWAIQSRKLKSWPKKIGKYKINTAAGTTKWLQSECIVNNKYAFFVISDITNKLRNDLRNELIHNALDKSHLILTAVNRKNWNIEKSGKVPFLFLENADNKRNILILNNAHENIYKYSMEKFRNPKGTEFWLDYCVHPDNRESEKSYWDNASWPKNRFYKIINSDRALRLMYSTVIEGKGEYDFGIEEDVTELVNYIIDKVSVELEKKSVSKNIIEHIKQIFK